MSNRVEENSRMLKILEAIFRAHGFESIEQEGWLAPNGQLPAIKASWYPEATESVGQLTVEVFLDKRTTVIESFAGFGEKKLESALENFIQNSLPVFLAAFWKDTHHNVSTEIWNINGQSYQSFIGDYGVINTAENFEIPDSYMDLARELIETEPLTHDVHWFNLFYANFDGKSRHAEALKDNDKWDKASKAITMLPWKKVYNYYSVRQFIVLKKLKNN